MDKKYTITVHTSETKEVTKEQYISHIEQKFRFRYDEVMNARAKAIKALAQVKEQEEKLELIKFELQMLVGPEDLDKHLTYTRWAYEEQNPRKAKLLQEKAL